MNDPLVSVLLPFRDAANYLADAIDSILAQTLTDFELILLDDGSSDGSTEIATRYRDPRIGLVRSETGIGLSRQLNLGIDLARGKYIARMDADDVSLPQRLERQQTTLVERRDVGICGTIVRTFGHQGDGPLWDYPLDWPDVQSVLFLRSCFCHPSVMWNAGLVHRVGLRFREDFVVAQDYAFWYELLKHTRGINLSQPLLRYRRFPEQLSQTGVERKWIEADALWAQMHADLGLDDSASHLEMHRAFAIQAWEPKKEILEDATDWLNLVYQRNLEQQLFPPRAFGRLLAKTLYMQCYMASRRGINGGKVFRRALFHVEASPGIMATTRMWLKSVLLPAI